MVGIPRDLDREVVEWSALLRVDERSVQLAVAYAKTNPTLTGGDRWAAALAPLTPAGRWHGTPFRPPLRRRALFGEIKSYVARHVDSSDP